jgi:transcription-repair coupling factor (superfamily II helicase)
MKDLFSSTSLHALLSEICTQPHFQKLLKLLDFSNQRLPLRPIVMEQLIPGSKPLILSVLSQSLEKTKGRPILWILPDLNARQELEEALLALLPTQRVLTLPAWDTLPGEEVEASPEIVGERYKTLEAIKNSSDGNFILLAPLQALLQPLPAPGSIQAFLLSKSSAPSHLALQEKLRNLGYERVTLATDRGQYAVRGGIIDLYPSTERYPIRVEYDGSQLCSMRYYDPATQRTFDIAKEAKRAIRKESLENKGVFLYPAKESTTHPVWILDHLESSPILFFDDLLALEETYEYFREANGFAKGLMTLEQFFSADESSDENMAHKAHIHCIYCAEPPIEKIAQDCTNRRGEEIKFPWLMQEIEGTLWKSPFISPLLYFDSINNPLLSPGDQLLQSAFDHQAIESIELYLLGHNEQELTFYEEKLLSLHLTTADKVHLEISQLSHGIVDPEGGYALIPYRYLTGRSVIENATEVAMGNYFSPHLFEFSPGDHLVHQNHGVGRYIGSEQRPNQFGSHSEYFILEYADNSRLCVPYTQAHLLSKYIGANYSKPTLHSLSSTKWTKQCSKTQESIASYAKELLELYALRSNKKRTPYPSDSHLMNQFELEFGFKVTPDQATAIQAVKTDLTSGKVMDRLICGDVGFGKTEVAMRAAFKTAIDGKQQVALLVPTTVLAMQHYDNFKERMQPYGLRVGIISRFSSAKEISQTLKELSQGNLDILIGTHKVVGNKVKFHNLGLLIIDEEQRLGVKVKEKLKAAYQDIHCLTLSATPIPRTLYLSLVGARDLSIIATPPFQRLPTKTVITESQDQTIQSALLREISRGGQAFVIHNRVETIEQIADRVKKLIPHATIAIAHGQMETHQLDEVFHQFKQGHIQILVATILVGNGIDIPRANTLIVDRAELFGLSDLYQLRGRVGRWNRRAYAYFLTPPNRVVASSVEKRLQALLKASSYGGGMLIAQEDLEHRGAGDILGTQQSGQIATVGFHLYCKLLKQQVEALSEGRPMNFSQTRIDLPFDAQIPESYIQDLILRQEFYRRLGETTKENEIDEIAQEMMDRFGTIPESVDWLLAICKIKILCHHRLIQVLAIKQGMLHLELSSSPGKEGKGKGQKLQHPIGRITSPQQLYQRAIHIITSQLE